MVVDKFLKINVCSPQEIAINKGAAKPKSYPMCSGLEKKWSWPYLFNCLHQFLVEVAETRPELGHIEEEAVHLVGLPGA